jgi:hypothetical protein
LLARIPQPERDELMIDREALGLDAYFARVVVCVYLSSV